MAALFKEPLDDRDKKAQEARVRDQLDPLTRDYDLALLLQPKEPRLYLARARRYADLKRDKEAEADFAKAVEINPKDPQVWIDRARIYAELGQVDKAAADFTHALELRPKDISWWSRLVRYELAPREEVLAKVIKLRPEDKEFRALVEESRAFEVWAKAVAGLKVVQHKTATVASGVSYFEHVPQEPALLVGFSLRTSSAEGPNHLVVGSLQPIYLTAEGQKSGPNFGGRGLGHLYGKPVQVTAKTGYAVGGIVVKWSAVSGQWPGPRVDALKVVFMRIDGARLDPKDRYESPWLGGKLEGQEGSLGGDGRPVIGIHGASGWAIDRLGLVQLQVGSPKSSKKP
jgi:hypothetical protein